MPKLKDVSGGDLVKFFVSNDFLVLNQCGGHIKLRRTIDGRKQTLIIPNHTTIRAGTLRAIYVQALAYVSDETLRKYFYSE